MPRIGVLALQGAFIEHIHKLERLGVDTVQIRLRGDLEACDGLIIPGGESTTIGKLIERFELREPILEMHEQGKPIWGTCAGMILLAKSVDETGKGVSQPLLGLMDLAVRRNAFGSQLDSFETELAIPIVGTNSLPAIFIRAPVVTRAGDDVDVLSALPDGRIVAARQGSLVATAFHPELTADDRFHRWFADLVADAVEDGALAARAGSR